MLGILHTKTYNKEPDYNLHYMEYSGIFHDVLMEKALNSKKDILFGGKSAIGIIPSGTINKICFRLR